MLYTYRKTGYAIVLQGKEFGTLTTRNGTAEIALTGSPINLQEGNEFRIAVSRCTASGAFVACLVADKSESRELMEFSAHEAGQELSARATIILVESVDAAQRTAIVRMKTDKPFVLKSGSALHIMLERVENEGVRVPHAVIGIMQR